jgi:chromosome segregation ATPase
MASNSSRGGGSTQRFVKGSGVHDARGDVMKEQIEQRLEQLKAEFEQGEKMLVELDAKRATLKETMLRISGAIQALEETLGNDAAGAGEQTERSEEKEALLDDSGSP